MKIKSCMLFVLACSAMAMDFSALHAGVGIYYDDGYGFGRYGYRTNYWLPRYHRGWGRWGRPYRYYYGEPARVVRYVAPRSRVVQYVDRTPARTKAACTKCYCSDKCGARDVKPDDRPFYDKQFGLCFCKMRDKRNYLPNECDRKPEKDQHLDEIDCCP